MSETARPAGYICEILEKLEHAGYPSFLVGGCVRDMLMGLRPHDWDIATPASCAQVCGLFARTAPTGVRYGTVTVFYRRGKAEITTFRSDGEYRDSRHPENVVFTGSIEQDLARRDFTVNAMAMDLHGRVFDPFGGRADIAAGVIRCVGDPYERFSEDALRILRAVRFSARFGWRIDDKTLAAMSAKAPLVADISAERVRYETEQIICSCHPEYIERLTEFRIYNNYVNKTGEKRYSFAGMARLPRSSVCRWAAFCMALGAQDASDTLARFRLDRNTVSAAASAVSAAASSGWDTSAGIRRLAVEYGRAAVTAASYIAGAAGRTRAALRGACVSPAELKVDGRDILAAGYAGKEVGDVMRRLLDHLAEHPGDNERDTLLKML